MPDGNHRRRLWPLIGGALLLTPPCVYVIGECTFHMRTQAAMHRAVELHSIYTAIETHARSQGNVPPQSLDELIELGILSDTDVTRYDEELDARATLYYCPVPTLDAEGSLYLLIEFHEASSWRGLAFVNVAGGYLGIRGVDRPVEEIIAGENESRERLGLPPCITRSPGEQ